ncbi:MAG: GDSL-type esterase/lipase family protein [Faecalibacterium prausnitzii]
MGEFVGKRVVPDHVGVWDQKKTYEPLMIVLDGETGDSYISRKAVPVGVSLADESYWSLCAHYSAQMRKLEQDVDVDVQQMHSDVTAVKNAMSQEFQETHTAISKELDDTHKAISQELSETEQRVNENLEQTSSELTGKVEQAKSDLNTGRQELKDAKDTLNKRMDSIAGGKTSDAEILDARVDADGNTHENLGAHIRSGFESARADQEEAVNHIGRMAAVSDAMRTANMVHTVDFGASNTSGDVKATAVSLGHGDRAGVIINGALKEGENDVSVLRFTEPMAFKAGTPYTVFIDETTPKVGYGIYFYEVGTGNCLQVGGINRGFTPANTKIATAVFDNGGMFRAGIYSTNCEFENHELHLYVVEGEYTQRDFFGLSTVADVSGNVAEIASVRDEVRKNNLIVMKQVILKNEENEPLWTSTPVGALNLGATVLNGQLGPTAGTYAVQISSPFMLDKEKDYTLFLLDERKDLEYSVYLLDETTWKDVMENGATRAFNVIHSPCGLIPAHQTGKHQLRIWVQQDITVEPYTPYCISAAGKAGYGLYAFYDVNGNRVGGENNTGNTDRKIENKVVTSPARAVSIRVACINGMQSCGIQPMTRGYFIGMKPKWYGRTWVCLGDSLTESNSRTTKHYFDYIAEKTGIKTVNLGVSGTGYMRRKDINRAFYQRVSDIPEDADVITIFGSGNDLSSDQTLGTVTDTGTDTICGCINATIDAIYERIPLARLGIVTPTPWVGSMPSKTTCGMAKYSEAIVEICKRRSIPCLDLYHESNLRPDDENFRKLAFSKDGGNGVHPDEKGHEIIAASFQSLLERPIL